MSDGSGSDGYGGVIGAFPYAFRRSESRLFRLYWIVGTLLAVALTVFFALGLIVTVADTLDTTATLSLGRSFLVLVGFLVILPVLAPVLFVARRHRRGTPRVGYDRRLGLAGFAFLGSLYLGLVPTVPSEHRDVPEGAVTILSVDVGGVTVAPSIPAAVVDGAIGPAIAWLYALPPVVGLGIALAGACSIYYAHRTAR